MQAYAIRKDFRENIEKEKTERKDKVDCRFQLIVKNTQDDWTQALGLHGGSFIGSVAKSPQ